MNPNNEVIEELFCTSHLYDNEVITTYYDLKTSQWNPLLVIIENVDEYLKRTEKIINNS